MRHPRLLRLQRERSPNPARLSSSGRDDPTSKYLHKSRCRPHAAPAILLANLGAGISPRRGSRTREGGAGSGRRREGLTRVLPGHFPRGLAAGHVPVSRQSRGVASSVSHGLTGPSSSREPRIFWKLVLGSPLPRRKGIPSPPSSGKSPTKPRAAAFLFSLSFFFFFFLFFSPPSLFGTSSWLIPQLWQTGDFIASLCIPLAGAGSWD